MAQTGKEMLEECPCEAHKDQGRKPIQPENVETSVVSGDIIEECGVSCGSARERDQPADKKKTATDRKRGSSCAMQNGNQHRRSPFPDRKMR